MGALELAKMSEGLRSENQRSASEGEDGRNLDYAQIIVVMSSRRCARMSRAHECAEGNMGLSRRNGTCVEC